MSSFFLDTAGYDYRKPIPGSSLYDYNVDFGWEAQKASGAQYAFLKASEGIYYQDRGFLIQWPRVLKAGLVRGAYHFFRCNQNAISQAKVFIGILRLAGVNPTDKLILDFETMDGIAAIPAMKAAASFVYEVKNAFPNNEIVIYTGYYFWGALLIGQADGSWAKNYSLWLPSYPKDPYPGMINVPQPWYGSIFTSYCASIKEGKYVPRIPVTWPSPKYWQFTAWADTRSIPGHPAIKKVADVNIAYVDALPTSETPFTETSKETLPTYSSYKVTATGGLNVRSAPPVNGVLQSIVGGVAYNSIVTVYEVRNGWALINMDGKHWCSMTFLVKVL